MAGRCAGTKERIGILNDLPEPIEWDRKRISDATRTRVSHFYGGLRCVVSRGDDIRGCPHHLNGRPNESEFPNLLPLNLELHNGLRRKAESPENLKPELRSDSLLARADEHFRVGRVAQAYGCLRLAYAMCTHFHAETEPVLELRLAAHCLYFLRRSVGRAPLDMVCSILEWILEREIQPMLTANRIRPPFGEFCLLTELGSWLNEFGWSRDGLDLLERAGNHLSQFVALLGPAETARFERQLANSLIQLGIYGRELQKALASAAARDAHENNQFAIFTTQMNERLSREQPKESLSVLEKKFDFFKKHTDDCFGNLTRIEATIQTSLGYMGLGILSQSQIAKSERQRQKVKTLIKALEEQEINYRVVTRFNRIPNLDSSIKRAAENLTEMGGFLEKRLFPVIPAKSAESIRNIAVQLTTCL